MLYTKKGQALVEFVIILPIFVFMILAVIDLGKILYLENNLESRMDDVISSYKVENSIDKIKENLKKDDNSIKLEVDEKDEYIKFRLFKESDIVTPGLNLILGNPFNVEATRVIYHE